MAVISYKCPNCGGDLRFDPKTQQYKCEYCLSVFGEEEMQSSVGLEKEQNTADQETDFQGEAMIYTCPSCGAEIMTDATTAATFCYYCHNPVVLQGRLSGDYLPDKVLPFRFDRKEAEDRFLQYVHKKKFIPKDFFSKKQIEKLSGVYFPYWVCEYTVDGRMDAKATKIRVYCTGDLEYTETRYYDIRREARMTFSGMSAGALTKEERKLSENVQPYRFSEMEEFHMGYLSGFFAEKRDIERTMVRDTMLSDAKRYAKETLRDSVRGYNAVTSEQTSVNVEKENWQYCLLPVWLVTYRGKGKKIFYYAMNGQTGEVFGELPVDYRKIAVLFAAVFFPVFLLLLLGGYWL